MDDARGWILFRGAILLNGKFGHKRMWSEDKGVDSSPDTISDEERLGITCALLGQSVEEISLS